MRPKRKQRKRALLEKEVQLCNNKHTLNLTLAYYGKNVMSFARTTIIV